MEKIAMTSNRKRSLYMPIQEMGAIRTYVNYWTFKLISHICKIFLTAKNKSKCKRDMLSEQAGSEKAVGHEVG